MTPGAAAIVASAVVIGRPVWPPAVLAALARLCLAQLAILQPLQDSFPADHAAPADFSLKVKEVA